MKIDINGKKMNFPQNIKIEHDKKNNTMAIEILKPENNMQEDEAAFEAWALLLKTNNKVEKIVLSFKEINIDKENYFNGLVAEQQHYMRFLYRLTKFEEQFSSWFSVDSSNVDELDFFREKFNSVKKINNIPEQESQYKETKGIEHILEKAFVNIPGFKEDKAGIDFNIADQLPNGLFCDEVTDKNRIFNAGYIDLWGIDSNNSLSIFELKEPKNKKAGIISELYFYANYISDLILEKNNFKLNRQSSKYRNYHLIDDKKEKYKKVRAIFLVPKLHAGIEKNQPEILSLLNHNNSSISYEVLNFELTDNELPEVKNQLEEIFQKKNT